MFQHNSCDVGLKKPALDVRLITEQSSAKELPSDNRLEARGSNPLECTRERPAETANRKERLDASQPLLLFCGPVVVQTQKLP